MIVSAIVPGSGGVDVFVDVGTDQKSVEALVTNGRKFALDSAIRAGHQVNVLASEYGPFPVMKSSGAFITGIPTDEERATLSQEDQAQLLSKRVNAAIAANDLVYRKKFTHSFAGF